VRIPDSIEPLVGWRYWRLDDAGRLASLGDVGFSWQPGEPYRAYCKSGQRDPYDFRHRYVSGLVTEWHDSPEERCRCGLYAARSLEDLRGQLLTGLALGVVGEVFLWGKVIPGQLGYRAQFAYPKRLYVMRRTHDSDRGELAEGLEPYGVPVDVVAYREVAYHPWYGITGTIKRLRSVFSGVTTRSSR
jgi:hypothetical protein